MAEPAIREYEERDRDACRQLWAELTQWHREGRPGVVVNPAARNADALRNFHRHGFDVLGQLERVLDLARPERWRPGERLADCEFRV